MLGLRVGPAGVEDRIGELAPFFLIEIANLQEDLREDVLIEARVAGRRQRRVLPLQPARGIDERPILLGEARARQAIDRRRDLLHVVRARAGRAPELARLVGIDLADDEPVGLLQRVDVLARIRPDLHTVHAEREDALDVACVHLVPDLRPGVIAIDLRQVVERPVVALLRRVAVHRFQKRDGEFWCVRPVVEGIPLLRLRRRRGDPLRVGGKILVVGIRHLEIAGENIEHAGKIRRPLDVGMSAQRVDAAAGAPDVAEQQLQHRGRSDDLAAECVLRPADGVDHRRHLRHLAVFTDRREQIRRLQELILRDAGDPLHHLRGVARVLLFQELKHAARMRQRRIVGNRTRERRHRGRRGGPGAAGMRPRAAGLRAGWSLRRVAEPRQRRRVLRGSRCAARLDRAGLRFRLFASAAGGSLGRPCSRGGCRLGRAHQPARLIVPCRLVVGLLRRIEA